MPPRTFIPLRQPIHIGEGTANHLPLPDWQRSPHYDLTISMALSEKIICFDHRKESLVGCKLAIKGWA